MVMNASRAVALIVTLWASVALGEPLYSFDSTPGKLPKSVVPSRYAIELMPDLQKLVTAGRETIEIDVREAVRQVVLNAADISIEAVYIDDDARRAELSLDPMAQTATLTFTNAVSVGPHKLHLTFSAKINAFSRGLFYVDYPTEAGTRRMISSQLEPADARRIFPCWDEPAFKASFALTVTVPQTFMTIGNMPIAKEEPLAGELKRVTFAPTPKMSSYLFVLSSGELERITADADGVTVGVVVTKGKAEHGRFALENAVRLLGYFNNYFGEKYPLPKLDLIAVPGGFGGAMENWGGITFFESRLLFDPAANSDAARRGIFGILAHEMAHQWFGDLVTMGWWDNLWLNEGFASWMQEKAAEHFYPQWKTWLNGYGQKQFGMALDARRTSHPIQLVVPDHSVAMTAFDPITYNKGQALIRMLENYLGEGAFRDGIRRHMAAHAYGNATTADLWQALEAATGKPVSRISSSFTEQEGVPLVIAETMCEGSSQKLTLRQDRFAVVPSTAKEKLPARHWQLPIQIGMPGARQPSHILLLDGSADVSAGACGEAVKVNFGDIGYYRVEYGANARAALVKALAKLSAEDRLNVLADSWTLMLAGYAEPPSWFTLVDALDVGDQRAIWDQVIGAFAQLERLSRARAARPALEAYMRARLRPVFDRIGWDGGGSGDDDNTLLRASLIRVLGEFGDADILAEARRRFAGFVKDPKSLPPDLRDSVSHLVGVFATPEDYDTLIALARASTVTSERVRYYVAAASSRDPVLAVRSLQLTLTGEVPVTISGGLINTVAQTGWQPQLAWDFIQENLKALTARQGPRFQDDFVPNFMTNFHDEAHASELAQFAPAQATTGGRVMTARALEAIALSADIKMRVLPEIDRWISEHPARQ
jgi:aminopeptidase N